MYGMYKNYINDIIDSMINNKIKNKGIFIKHYNNFNVHKEDIKRDNQETYNVLYYEYNSKFIQRAYEPIVNWIRDLYIEHFSHMDIYDFLNESNVYELHKSSIKTFIVNEICVREEDIIISEIEFESKKFIESLCNILKFIAKEVSLVIILNKLHLSNISIIKFIEYFIENNKDSNVILLATYNEAYDVDLYMKEEWIKLIELIEREDLLEYIEVNSEYYSIEERSSFVPSVSELNYYIKKINNMVFTLTLDQAQYYLDMIYSKLDIEKISIDIKVKIRFLALYSLVNIYNMNISKALLLCNNMNNLTSSIQDIKYSYISSYIYGLAQVQNGQYLIAEEFSKKCEELANKMNDDYYKFKTQLLKYMSLFRGLKGLFLSGRNYVVEENLYAGLVKYNYYNHLSYINILAYESREDFCISNFKENDDFSYINKSIEIAKKIGNDNFLVESYLKMAELASCNCRYDAVERFYNECLKVVKKINNKSVEAEIFNGLGYNLIVGENYKKANDSFNSSITILYEIGDIEKIAEVLYNMGMNCLNARHYKEANEYFINSLKIIDYLNMGCIRVCNLSKIYGLVALCNYYLGIEYTCYEYFSKMKRILAHLIDSEEEVSTKLWDDDLYLYYLIKALIHKKEDNFELIKESFNQSKMYMKISIGSLFYSYPILSIEESKFYRSIGQEEKAKEILKECIDFCKGRGYNRKVDYLETCKNNELCKEYNYKMELESVSIKLIIELAKRRNAEIQLEEQKKEMSFLLLWQDTLNREALNKKNLIDKSIRTLQNNFSVEGIIYLTNNKNKWEVLFKDDYSNLGENNINKIVDYFKKNKKEFIICRNERNFEIYREIIKIIGVNKVYSIIGIPIFENEKLTNILITYIPVYNNFIENKISLRNIHLYIFSYIFKQLLDSINKIEVREEIEKINKKLNLIAITDQLTGIYNRQGFEKKLNEESNKTTILYIDLDNFKYYNDTYGHHVGDYILVSFANILNKVIKNKNGYAVRYGGDEFILGIPNGTNEEGVDVAKYIFSQINEESFINDINSFIKKDEKNRIACSIGISTSLEANKASILEALKYADRVLYEVKKANKNNYKVWNNS